LTAAGPWFCWRGEPPAAAAREAAPKLPSLEIQGLGRVLSKLLPSDLPDLAKGGLGMALSLLAKVLASQPMAGHLLCSPRYSDIERRVAQYAYPLVDPQLQMLVEGDDALKADILEGMKDRGTDGFALVKSLKIPASVALGAVWGVLRKLMIQPIVPNELTLNLFIIDEAHKNDVLETALRRLRTRPTSLRHRRGGGPLSTLHVVFLRYRGSPARESRGRVLGSETVSLLAENEYVVGEDGPPTDVWMDDIVDDARSDLIAWLGSRVAKEEIGFADDWPEKILPSPGEYVVGALLPQPVSTKLETPPRENPPPALEA
jgi:hypothetical protein